MIRISRHCTCKYNFDDHNNNQDNNGEVILSWNTFIGENLKELMRGEFLN